MKTVPPGYREIFCRYITRNGLQCQLPGFLREPQRAGDSGKEGLAHRKAQVGERIQATRGAMTKNRENEEFALAVALTHRAIGPPPIVGSFEPKLGDIGRIEQTGEYVIWNGECWIGKDAQKVGEGR